MSWGVEGRPVVPDRDIIRILPLESDLGFRQYHSDRLDRA